MHSKRVSATRLKLHAEPAISPLAEQTQGLGKSEGTARSGIVDDAGVEVGPAGKYQAFWEVPLMLAWAFAQTHSATSRPSCRPAMLSDWI